MKKFVSKNIILGLALIVMAGRTFGADCAEVVILPLDTGWYDASGYHSPINDDYFCGDGNNIGFLTPPLRNWFAFSIPVLTQKVVSASLRVQTFFILSDTGSETYQLRHVRTAVPTLRAGGSGLRSIYADLGDGTIYGSRVFLTNESFGQASISLNDAFVSNLVAAAGTTLAIGGEISSLDVILGNNEQIFSGSSAGTDNVQLVLTLANASPLSILAEPQSQSVPAGTHVTFAVEACGSSALHYQWQLNETNYPWAPPNSFLTLFNVTSDNAGSYRVVITNLSGSVTSAVATLAVNYQAPTVAAYLASGPSPAFIGDGVNVCADATGAPFPTLQWQFNGTNVPGQNGQCFPQSNVQTNQSGRYTVVASNAVGVVTSAVVSVLVTARPPVAAFFAYQQPPIAIGSYTYMCARISISPAPSYQWQFNGADLPGQTDGCLFISRVATNSAGFYTVVASNVSGIYTSAPIELTVYYQAPTNNGVFFLQGSSMALVGNDLTVCASVGGSPPLSFQWRFNGVDLPGENSSCLSLFQISPNQEGDYSFVASNLTGVVTSAAVTVTVNYREPQFVYQPSSQTVVEGSTVRINGDAPAGPPATHVLQFNGTNAAVPFSYSSSVGGFTLLDVVPADAGEYRVIASNSMGVATSMVATLTVTPAGPLDRWTQRNPLPQSQRLFSVAHGNGLFVAVGDRGTIVTSHDGTNWFLQSRRADVSLQGVAYGAGLFVAAGYNGTILASPDGTNWTYRYSAPSSTFRAVTYGNARFVVIGDLGGQTLALSSSNGIAWEKNIVPVDASSGVTFGNGVFVAVGSSEIITSTNALDWSVTLTSLSSSLEKVAFVNNQFIAVGNNGYMLASPDGFSWSGRNSGTTRRLLGVTYGNGKFVAAGVRGTILTSLDANTWTAAASGTPDRLEAVQFGGGLFIAVGENGTTIISTNGTSWTKQNEGPTRDLDGMALANGTIAIVGKAGTIITSTDGTHYTEQNSGVTNDLHGIAWGNGLWVAVGEPGTIVTSPDAVQWTQRLTQSTNSLKGATYGGGTWVVVGTQGSVITSADGVNWSGTATSPAFDLNDVTYGNGAFVIAGDGQDNQNGSCFISSNAVTWTWLNSFPFGKNLRSILFTNGTFLTTGNDGYVFASTNGLNWFPHYTGVSGNMRDATWARGVWIVVGNNGRIHTSSNLLAWTQRPTRTFENLHGVAYLDGKLVAIGNRGTVLQSGRFITGLEFVRYQRALEPAAASAATLAVNGIVGQVYRLEASTNLIQWTNLSRFTNTAERMFFTDNAAAVYPRRFYRITKD